MLRRCTSYTESGQILPLTEEKRTAILAENKAMADKALRVLAAAERLYDALPDRQEPEDLEQDLCFIGLAGMIDPIRPEVKAAVAECRAAGIRPVMITGDHKDTAVAIGKELGIEGLIRLLSGKLACDHFGDHILGNGKEIVGGDADIHLSLIHI